MDYTKNVLISMVMRILCVIDSLGSGGAQRQMVNLACGLKRDGFDIEMLIYYPEYRFFRSRIDSAGIFVHEMKTKKGFSLNVLFRIRELFCSGRYAAVISFLNTPNIYCELAKLLAMSRMPLVVSERSSWVRDKGSIMNLKRIMHIFANFVVANSYSQATWLRKNYMLREKVCSIYNGYDVVMPEKNAIERSYNKKGRYVVVGRICKEKNGVRLIKALELYLKKYGHSPYIAWAGRQENDGESQKIRMQMEELLEKQPMIKENWNWLGECDNVSALLKQSDALIHVSLYEGLPNVVCEAFVEGVPVIVSNVCDHPILVKDGVRGVLCDPLSEISIFEAIERFEAIGEDDRISMGINARHYAEQNLTIEKMVLSYKKILNIV